MKRGKPFDEQMTDEMYERAWNLKSKGFSDGYIARELGFSLKTYDAYKWKIRSRYARITRLSLQYRMRQGIKGSKRFNKLRRSAVELAKLGESFSAIARQLGTPKSTLKAWMDTDALFNHEMRTAKDAADDQVIRSLLKRATGYSVRQANKTTIKDGRGRVLSETVNEKTKTLAPNIGAIKLWLVNRRGWISEAEGVKIDEDGKNVEYDIRENLYAEGNTTNEN